jgi:DMSO/TMAO reductase YedYZ heme-binding membrane subunit
MPHIIGIVFALVISLVFREFIMKKEKIVYVISVVVAIGLFLLGLDVQGGVSLESFLPSGFFIVVMYIGVLANNNKLRAIRRQLSIIAFILITPHVIIYFLDFLQNIFDFNNTYKFLSYLIGIILTVIMIPLFITSFIKFRKKFTPKNWKKLHKFSYLAYTLIYIHILFVGLSSGDMAHPIIVSVVFGVYTVLRVRKYLKK